VEIITYGDAVNFLEIGKAYKVTTSKTSVVTLVLGLEPLPNSEGFAIVCGFGLCKYIFRQGLSTEENPKLGMFSSTYKRYKENSKQFIRDIGSITISEEL